MNDNKHFNFPDWGDEEVIEPPIFAPVPEKTTLKERSVLRKISRILRRENRKAEARSNTRGIPLKGRDARGNVLQPEQDLRDFAGAVLGNIGNDLEIPADEFNVNDIDIIVDDQANPGPVGEQVMPDKSKDYGENYTHEHVNIGSGAEILDEASIAGNQNTVPFRSLTSIGTEPGSTTTITGNTVTVPVFVKAEVMGDNVVLSGKAEIPAPPTPPYDPPPGYAEFDMYVCVNGVSTLKTFLVKI